MVSKDPSLRIISQLSSTTDIEEIEGLRRRIQEAKVAQWEKENELKAAKSALATALLKCKKRDKGGGKRKFLPCSAAV